MATLTERQKVRNALAEQGVTNVTNIQIDQYVEANRNKLQDLLSGPQIASQTTAPPQEVSTGGFYTPATSRGFREPAKEEVGQSYDEIMSSMAASEGRGAKRPGLIEFTGNALWNFIDSASFGVAGWLDNTDVIEEAFTGKGGPQTSWGSIGAGIGGLAGFITGPFGAAKGVSKMAVKGLAKEGTRKTAEKLLYTSGKPSRAFKNLEKKSKTFKNLSDEKKTQFFKPWTESITKEIPRLNTQAQRDQFAKLWRTKTEAQLARSLEQSGIKIKPGSENFKKITDDIIETIGIKKGQPLPVSSIQELLAKRWGNGKLADIGATALEEGTLFAAAESIPHIIHNLRENKEWNENMGGTLAHAFVLGNVFGGIKYVPGGTGMPIIPTALRRLKKQMGAKKPYEAYDLGTSADRELLSDWSVSLWRASERAGHGSKLFTDLGLKGVNDKTITKAGDLVDLIKLGIKGTGKEADKVAGAARLKGLLQQSEKNWNKSWWGLYAKEAVTDLKGSALRMGLASAAMNFDTENGLLPLRDDIPLADKIYHIALGAFMGRRGKELVYTGADGNRKTAAWSEKAPLGEDYKRVSSFLNILGSDHDNLIFNSILHDNYIRSKYIRPDAEHADVKKMRELFEQEGLIVDESMPYKEKASDATIESSIIKRIKKRLQAPGKDGVKFKDEASIDGWLNTRNGQKAVRDAVFQSKASRGKGTEGSHPVYEHLDLVSTRTFLQPGERLLSVSELSPNKLKRIENLLSRTGEFDTVKGVRTLADIDEILISASDAKVSNVIENLKNEVRDLYTEITGVEPQINKESGMLGMSELTQPTGLKLTDSQSKVIQNFLNARDLLERIGHITVSKAAKIKYDPNAFREIQVEKVGEGAAPEITSKVDRLYTKARNAINELVNESPNVSERYKVELGEEWLLGLVEGQSYFKSFRNMHNMLLSADNANGSWKQSLKGESHSKDFHDLLNRVMTDENGFLVSDWNIGKGTEAQNIKNMQMLRSLKKMMEVMPDWQPQHAAKAEFAIDVKANEVTATDLNLMRRMLRESGMNIFDRSTAEVDGFTRSVADYGVDKFIRSATKMNPDGTSSSAITASDKMKVQFLMEQGIGDYTGTILDLQLIDPLQAVLPKALKQLQNIERASKGLEPHEYADFLSDNAKFRLEDMNKDVRDNIERLVKERGTADVDVNDQVAKVFADIMRKYQEHIKPYMKVMDSKGEAVGGIFSTSKTKAAAGFEEFTQLVMTLEALDKRSNKLSHERFVEAVEGTRTAENLSDSSKKLLEMLHIRFYYGKVPSNKAIKFMQELGLYKEKGEDGIIDLSHANLEQRTQAAITRLKTLLPKESTEQMIEQRIQEYKDAYDKEFEVESQRHLTDVEFMEKYHIDPESFKTSPDLWGDETINMLIGETSLKDKETGKVTLYDQMNHHQKKKVALDAIAMMMTKYNGRNIRRIFIDEQAGPVVDTKDISFKNPVFEWLDNMLVEGEFVIVDSKVSTTHGWLDARDNPDALNILGSMLGNTANKQAITHGFKKELDGNAFVNIEGGYLPIFMGDVKWAIGIPNNQATLNRIANSFGAYLETMKTNFTDPKYEGIIEKLNHFAFGRAGETGKLKKIEEKITGPDGKEIKAFRYEFNKSTHGPDRQAVNLMLTHTFMNEKLPAKLWMDQASGSLTNPEFGAKFAKRVRMMMNPTNKTIDRHVLDSAVKGYGKLVDDKVPGVRDTHDALKKMQEGINIVLVADENFADNKLFSTFDQIDKQIEFEAKEMGLDKARPEDIKMYERLVKEVRGDASSVDSYAAVSPSLWRALKALAGDGDKEGLGGIKPLITRLGKEGVMLGKTVFLPDTRMDAFFEKNKGVDIVLMQSAEKSKNKDLKVITESFKSWDDFNNMRVEDYTLATGEPFWNRVAAEDISLGSVVTSKHKATISYQLANELTPDAQGSFYNWTIAPRLNKFKDQANKSFNHHEPAEAISFAKMMANKRGGGLDGAYTKWLGFNGIPLDEVFLPTYKAQFKKNFIDDGIISMYSDHGGQSVLSPALPDSPLRNTLFRADAEGNPTLFTIGQMEIGHGNRSESVNLDRLNIIKHNKDIADEIITWREFKKQIKWDDSKIRNEYKEGNLLTLGKVYDALETIGATKAGYEIEISGWRPPSAKPSDKVTTGLKGFLDPRDGNQARMNVADLMLRLEGDFDVDKYNYFWDAPIDVVKEWNANANKILAIAPEAAENKSSLQGPNPFNWGDPVAMEKYNFDSSKASKMRGKVSKANRLFQFLTHYNSIEGYEGFALNPAGGRLININKKRLVEAKEILARDIQNIVDSTTGYNDLIYNDKWLSKFLFGGLKMMDGKSEWKGLFSTYKKEEISYMEKRVGKDGIEKEVKVKEWVDKVQAESIGDATYSIQQTMIMDAVDAYRTFLQLGSDVYEAGKGKSPRYDDFMQYYKTFRWRMGSINSGSKKRLLKRKPADVDRGDWEASIEAMYKDKSWDKRPYGDFGSNIMNTERMLPFDRAVFEMLETDKLAVDVPGRMFGDSKATFDKWFEDYASPENKSATIAEIIKRTKEDIKNVGFLNYLDFQIKKDTKHKFRAVKDKNNKLADTIQERISQSKKLQEEVESGLTADTETAKKMRKGVKRRVISEIYRNLKQPDGKSLKNIQAAFKYIESKAGKAAISKEVANKAIVLKSINSNEYLSATIWHEMMGKMNDIYLDPLGFKGEHIQEFEKNMATMVKLYNNQWKNFFDDKKRVSKRETWKDENSINELISDQMDLFFDKWEGIQPGLGRLFLFKFMAPKKTPGVYTYFNGKFIEGFENATVSKVRFGLKWLARPDNFTSRIGEFEVDAMYKEFASTYNNYWKMFHGKNIETGITEKNWSQLFINDAKAAMDDIKVAESMPLKDIFGHVTSEGLAGEVNPQLGSVFGYNNRETIGYIMSHNPVDPKAVRNLKMASSLNFIPQGFIPSDYNGGEFSSINGWSSYNKARQNNARIFLGDASKKGVLFYRDLPVSRMPFEETGTRVEGRADLKNTVAKNMEDQNKQRVVKCE